MFTDSRFTHNRKKKKNNVKPIHSDSKTYKLIFTIDLVTHCRNKLLLIKCLLNQHRYLINSSSFTETDNNYYYYYLSKCHLLRHDNNLGSPVPSIHCATDGDNQKQADD